MRFINNLVLTHHIGEHGSEHDLVAQALLTVNRDGLAGSAVPIRLVGDFAVNAHLGLETPFMLVPSGFPHAQFQLGNSGVPVRHRTL